MAVELSKDLSLILRWKREKEDPEEDSILSPCRKRIRRIGEEPIQIQIDIDSLLFEVLYRLPCRSALQFKSVSKRWYSLISHSEFVRRSIHHRHHHHHRHQFSKSRSDPFTLALYYDGNILALPFHNSDKEQGCINDAHYRYKVVSSPGDRRLKFFKIKTLQAGVVACNGKLHWVDTDKEDMIKAFLVFDPFNDAERLSYIDPPIEFSPKGSVSFGVFQGRLRMFHMFRGDPYHFDVWELEDYGNADTWCLKHKVYMKDLVSECSDLVKIAMDIWPSVSFLAFHPTVGEIAFLLFRNYIVLCNMRTKVLKIASKLREKGKSLDGDSLC